MKQLLCCQADRWGALDKRQLAFGSHWIGLTLESQGHSPRNTVFRFSQCSSTSRSTLTADTGLALKAFGFLTPEPSSLPLRRKGCFGFFVLFFLCLFGDAPKACGGSQARNRIRAVASGLQQSHSKGDPSHVWDLPLSSRQCQILKLLSEAKDRTCIPMDTSQIRFQLATQGTPRKREFLENIHSVFSLGLQKTQFCSKSP